MQNTYLAAVSLGLGTVCVGGIYESIIGNILGLPSTMFPVLAMPLGHSNFSYPSASPDYATMTSDLPLVKYSNHTFEDALNSMLFAQSWSPQDLSTQELSQLLWAGYGYSNTTHRTTPSAYDVYPLKILVLNATGVYGFTPENHSVTKMYVGDTEIPLGDKRLDVANACNGQTLAANAPALFLVVFNSTLGGECDTTENHKYIEIDAGCVAQQLLLEASAWNLSGNIIGEGLQQDQNGTKIWNETGAQQVRDALGGLDSSLVPLYAVPIGASADRYLVARGTDDGIYCRQFNTTASSWGGFRKVARVH